MYICNWKGIWKIALNATGHYAMEETRGSTTLIGTYERTYTVHTYVYAAFPADR